MLCTEYVLGGTEIGVCIFSGNFALMYSTYGRASTESFSRRVGASH